MRDRDKICNALWKGFPNAKWACAGTYATLEWGSADITKPTEKEFNDAVTEWNAEYDAQKYARNRQDEYPTIKECVHAILDDDLTALQTKRQAVKDKYPKPE